MIDILKVAEKFAGHADVSRFIDELKTIRLSGAKFYRTFLEDPNVQTPIVLLTTSKDIHLALGRLSNAGQQSLARTILRAFGEVAEKTGLILIPGDTASMLVSITSSGRDTVIHLSPAR
jgi:hypothetical protein